MNERDLEYFAVVALHQHLGRAAEALGLSQPALSLSLRRLEKSMQTKLVKRTPKGVELTATGTALLSHLGQLRLAHEDVAREVADLAQGRAGDLRIAAQPGTPEDLVAVAAAALLRETPKVTVRVSVSMLDVILPSLRNGELDLLVGTVPPSSAADLASVRLMHDQYAVYASTRHSLAGRKQVNLVDLGGERWVKTASSGASWKALARALEEAGLPPPQFALESNSAEVRRQAVASGGLLAIGARRKLRQHARRMGLVELPVTQFSASRDVAVTYRKDGYLSPAAHRMIEILKTTAREMSKEG